MSRFLTKSSVSNRGNGKAKGDGPGVPTVLDGIGVNKVYRVP